MAFQDLREFIGALERQGELQRIKQEVDWDLEVGGIIRRSYDLKAPAPLFEKIKGYPDGYRILGAPMGRSRRPGHQCIRVALALGMPLDSRPTDIIEEYIRRKRQPIKPKVVEGGSCKENILRGEEVDLLAFPVPLLHGGDGGRYIGTWHTVITRDPDSGWVNWAVYRLMVHDRNTMGGVLAPTQHIGYHYYRKYQQRRQPMEFAAAIGTEPVTAIISGTRIPAGVDEADVVGGVRGQPIELVRAETVDLMVPATAEIVLEGVIYPDERRDEGPFGEYTGYSAGDRAPRPVYHVQAITHRHQPILTASCPGVPIYDAHAVASLTNAAEVLDELRRDGFPVRMVYYPPEGIMQLLVVSSQIPFAHYATLLSNAVWSKKAAFNAQYLVVVEEDIDVTDLTQVIWSIITRCHPDRGICKVPRAPGHALLTYLAPHEKQYNLGAKVLFDCTWPKDWPPDYIPVKASFDVMWPQEIQERILQNWTTGYGYREGEGGGG